MSSVRVAALLLLLLPIWASPLALRVATAGVLADLPGVEIITADEVLAKHTEAAPDGTLKFRHADGAWIRMVTSVEDPEIRNQGMGAFFPPPAHEVEAAIRAIPRELLADLTVRVFLLPFPRSGMLGSSADGLGIYLTPGVREYSPAEIHYLVTHELGHAFHREHLPYEDADWDRFRAIRDLEEVVRFAFDGPHADRPQEIFAEDFRVLFGSELARGNGGVENPNVLRPDEVPGLEEFYRGLVHASVPAAPDGVLAERLSTFEAFPNPVVAGGRLTLRISDPIGVSSAALYDVSGRRVVGLFPETTRLGLTVTLEPSLAAGAYWLRLDLLGASARTVPIRVVTR